MSVIFEPAAAIPDADSTIVEPASGDQPSSREGIELMKEAVDDLPSSIELLEEAEEALERRLLDLTAYGLPLQMTTIYPRTTLGQSID